MTTSLTYNPRTDPVTRSLVTIGALIVLFLGTHIPLPGLNAELLRRLLLGSSQLGRASIFTLGVTPIILAYVILELCRVAIPALARWAAEPDHAGRWARIGRGLALALAGLQAYGVAVGLESVAGFAEEGGWAFRLGVVATAIGATALLIVLADLVTRRGLGDGLLILLAAPLVARAPHNLAFLIELSRMGAISVGSLLLTLALAAVAIGLLAAASLVRNPARRSGLANAELDIWPPLLATSVLGPLGAAAVLFLAPANLPAAPIVLVVHSLALAGLIALFAALRARAGAAPPNLAAVTAAETGVCVGAALYAYGSGMSSEAAGLWIIVTVAAALSCFSRSVRLETPSRGRLAPEQRAPTLRQL